MAALTTVVVAATAEAGSRTMTTALPTAGVSQNDSYSGTQDGVRPFQLHNWKQKADQAKKTEFIRTAEKLKNQVANIEKDKNGHLYNKKNDFRTDFIVLEELEHKLVNSRKTERAKMQQHLTNIHNNVKRFQQQLKDVESTPEFVEKLREMMEEVENAINTFKEEQRLIYEDLIKEEKITTDELNALERKIETWTLSNSGTERPSKVPLSRIPLDIVMPNNLPEEVLEFEKFLQQAGGRQGGWDDYDHQCFLKVRNKHRGKPSYVKEVLVYLPGRTEDDVQLHEKWYQKFLSLEERKKECIQKWKTKKQQEKKEMMTLKEKSEEVFMTHDLQQEESLKQKEEQRKKQKLAIEAWKKQKIMELSVKQASQLKEEQEKERKQQKEHQRQFHLKLLLEKYTQQKKEQEELLKLEKEMREKTEREERRKMATNEIIRFQERDLHKLELKILEKQEKKKEKTEKERRLAKLRKKVEVNVSRDPSRLYKLTKGWEERTKERGPTSAGPLLHMPHKAIPTWRQGL